MARIYEIRQYDGFCRPVVYSDEEHWLRSLCKHKHRSRREAQKCLTKALPRYMKCQRKPKERIENIIQGLKELEKEHEGEPYTHLIKDIIDARHALERLLNSLSG